MLCLGTLISDKYVLAPGHCLKNLPEGLRMMSVRIGDKDTSNEVDCEYDLSKKEHKCAITYQDILVENIIVHPKHSNDSLEYDLGLIRLKVKYDLTQGKLWNFTVSVRTFMFEASLGNQ
jgi:V8-like Glu-specific endopeptidase